MLHVQWTDGMFGERRRPYWKEQEAGIVQLHDLHPSFSGTQRHLLQQIVRVATGIGASLVGNVRSRYFRE